MPTPDEHLKACVLALVNAVDDCGIANPQSITIDFQASAEQPYRIVVPDEPLPIIGLAAFDRPRFLSPQTKAAERAVKGRR
jgi:hypothetical protein